MWKELDLSIKNRIKDNVFNEAFTNVLSYALGLVLVLSGILLVMNSDSTGKVLSSIMLALMIVVVCLGFLSLVYLFRAYIHDNYDVVKDARYVCLCRTTGRKVDEKKYFVLLRLPETKAEVEVKCSKSLYDSIVVDKYVMVVASNKYQTLQMRAYDPAVYDVDGVL